MRLKLIIGLTLVALMLVACGGTETVEVTRIVETEGETVEVEVTRVTTETVTETVVETVTETVVETVEVVALPDGTARWSSGEAAEIEDRTAGDRQDGEPHRDERGDGPGEYERSDRTHLRHLERSASGEI